MSATTDVTTPEAREGAPERVTLTGSEALVRSLKAAGIIDFFGVAGGSLSRVLKAVAEDPALRYVGTRHEAAGGFMAAATYAGTGKLAVALGEQGPGSLNLLSSMGNAVNNNLALIAVTSSPPTVLSRPFHGMFMEWDASTAFRAYTKASAQVNSVERVPQFVREALRAALTGRPGPVHIDLPSDVLLGSGEFSIAELDAPVGEYVAEPRTAGDPGAIHAAAQLLARAERLPPCTSSSRCCPSPRRPESCRLPAKRRASGGGCPTSGTGR